MSAYRRACFSHRNGIVRCELQGSYTTSRPAGPLGTARASLFEEPEWHHQDLKRRLWSSAPDGYASPLPSMPQTSSLMLAFDGHRLYEVVHTRAAAAANSPDLHYTPGRDLHIIRPSA
jgi:hypothetical protein